MRIAPIIATLITLAGCQTRHLNEPVRTEFYVGCLTNGWPISGCDCIEQGAFDNDAPTYIQMGDQAKGDEFSAAARKAIPECRAKTQQLMKDDLAPPKGDESNSRILRGH